MTEEEKKYVDGLIADALSIETDEIEGQQVIDLNALNLCQVDYNTDIQTIDSSLTEEEILNKIYSDPGLAALLSTPPDQVKDIAPVIPVDNKIIIEFADATVKDPEPVKFNIAVQPGEEINEETIIGFVEQEGKTKQIKSIFNHAHVCGINDNTDYLRLYPSICNRHIILENCIPESGKDYDLSVKINDLNAEFKNEAILYSLITNNMCQSLLPYVLSRRYRGVYEQINPLLSYNSNYLGIWTLTSDDLLFDTSIRATQTIQNSNKGAINSLIYGDNIRLAYSIDNNDTGLKIFDSSILLQLNEFQDIFGSEILGDNITKEDMKAWKKRAKKKKNRKKVQKEIQDRADNQTNVIKTSKNVEDTLKSEQDRVLNARNKYIDSIINLYKNKNKLPLCKYDPAYTDCKFLVNDTIDKDVLNNVKSYDDDFSYSVVGETEYFNYYLSLLSSINLQMDDDYTKEYYQIITDIINKRLIIEGTEPKDLKLMFMRLFNENISEIFYLYSNNKYNTETYINTQFGKFITKLNSFVIKENKAYANNIKTQFKDKNLSDDAIQNAGGPLYTDDNKYRQVFDYIRSIKSADDDDTLSDYTVSQLSSMFMYINSYKNTYNKNLKNDKNKYLYYELVKEEAQKITNFWDKILSIYTDNTITTCIGDLYTLSNSFEGYATWPIPSQITIDNVRYQHYLFEQMYKKDLSKVNTNVEIGNYNFPDHVDFPEIPDVSVNEDEALNDLYNPEQVEPTKDEITIFDPEYWRKYFTLATLISIPFLNCGLDIMPYIQLIQLPCIFMAITCVYIPFFNLLIVFGISFRGMYFAPVILYLNTSDSASSVLTPLIAVLNQLRNMFNNKIDEITIGPIQLIVDQYIKKLQEENNALRRENKKIDVYQDILKNVQLPDTEVIKRKFSKVIDPNLDFRQRYTSLDRLNRSQIE